MKKQADGLGNYAVMAAAAVVAASFIGGLGSGAAISKLTEPGEYDTANLQKEYRLSRLNKDNQTQQILAAREQAQRDMRNVAHKSMRAV